MRRYGGSPKGMRFLTPPIVDWATHVPIAVTTAVTKVMAINVRNLNLVNLIGSLMLLLLKLSFWFRAFSHPNIFIWFHYNAPARRKPA